MSITKTVGGASRDYKRGDYASDIATLQAALDFFNNYDFSSNGGGACYIDIYPEGTGGSNGEWRLQGAYLNTPTGTTNQGSGSLTIRAAPGYGIRDHADKATNPLAYNPAKGVGLRADTARVIEVLSGCNVLIFDGLQIKCDSAGNQSAFGGNASQTGLTVKNCLIHMNEEDSVLFTNVSYATLLFVNCVSINGSLNIAAQGSGGEKVVGCTFYRTTDPANRGCITALYGQLAVYDTICYTPGTPNDFATSSGGSFTGSNNASNDSSAPGTGSVTGLTMSSVFENLTYSTIDLRLAAGCPSSVKTGGTRRQTETSDLDIISQSRSTSTPSIGAWEYISANVFDLTGTRTIASTGHATLVGDPDSFTKYWRIPSNAAQGTTGRMVVFGVSGNIVTSIVSEGAVTADVNGTFDLITNSADAAGTKRFAIVHTWNGVTGTTSIYGGPAISEMVQV